MAQADFLARETVTYVGDSATFGVRSGATLSRLACEQGSVVASGFTEARLGVPDERQVRFDNPVRVRGLKWGSKWGPLKVLLKGIKTADKLNAGGTAAALSQRPFFKHGFGREYVALGCTVGSSSTRTSIVVDDSSLRQAGELVAVEITTGVWEVAKVAAVPDATHITLAHGLTTAPTSGLGVRGLYGYYCPETRNGSLVVEQSFVGASGNEYRALGCFGNLKFEFPGWGEIPRATLEGECVAWEGPTTLTSPSFGTATPADDDMGEALPWVPLLYLDSTIERQSDSPYRIEKMSMEFTSAWDVIPDGSNASAAGGVLDTAGRDGDVFGTLTMVIRSDPSELTNFTARSIKAALVTCASQDGASIDAWEFGRLYLTAPPKPVSLGKGRGGAELTFQILMDTTCTLPGSPTTEQKDLARSPVRYGKM